MTKADLVERVTATIARTAGPMISKKDCARVVDAFLDAVKDALAEQNNIEVRGFGTFKIRRRKTRMARNPRTGDPVEVADDHQGVDDGQDDEEDQLDDRPADSEHGLRIARLDVPPDQEEEEAPVFPELAEVQAPAGIGIDDEFAPMRRRLEAQRSLEALKRVVDVVAALVGLAVLVRSMTGATSMKVTVSLSLSPVVSLIEAVFG